MDNSIDTSSILLGDIVSLNDGRRGKVTGQFSDGMFNLCSNKGGWNSSFHAKDVILLKRQPQRKVRIYQIDPIESTYAFREYSYVRSMGRMAPPAELYKVVFDGQLGTTQLDDIFTIFNINHPKDYNGRSLSMSDIIELYDDRGSRFFYCDTASFRKIRFKPTKL